MNQLIVFPFFGENYLKQFKVCAKTIPSDWNVLVITDQNYLEDRFTVLRVDSPVSAYDCMTFRKRIPEFINIDEWDQVWHCDPDVLFTGDLLKKYSELPYSKYIIVSEETGTRIDCQEMGSGFNNVELEHLILNHSPAINGGLIGVPKLNNWFWEDYKERIDLFHEMKPDILSCDQQVLNILYIWDYDYFALTDKEDVGFPTRGTQGNLMNHYIGANIENKHELMQSDFDKRYIWTP
jgi:lipopolysaccharide biosynthesis glycosyltransferase